MNDLLYPIPVIETLNRILGAERGSLLRYLTGALPYVDPSAGRIWISARQMALTCAQHEADIIDLIEQLGGDATASGWSADHQYAGFLRLDHLCPRLLQEATAAVQRYEAALHELANSDARVVNLLRRHLQDHRRWVECLSRQP